MYSYKIWFLQNTISSTNSLFEKRFRQNIFQIYSFPIKWIPTTYIPMNNSSNKICFQEQIVRFKYASDQIVFQFTTFPMKLFSTKYLPRKLDSNNIFFRLNRFH